MFVSKDIPEEIASSYRDAYPAMRGRADLYVAFFEAALRQLKTNGTCAFICADRWMRNQYGAELRELVTSAYSWMLSSRCIMPTRSMMKWTPILPLPLSVARNKARP